MKKLFTVLFLLIVAFLETFYPQSANQFNASNIDAATATTVTFKQGYNSYSETVDTYIYQTNGNSSYGGNDGFVWDNDAGAQKVGLIRFNNIFGSGAGQIPPGSSILSATLQYYVNNEDEVGGSSATAYESKVDWDGNSTWNNFGGEEGVQSDEYYDTPAIDIPGNLDDHLFSVTVTSSVENWCNQTRTNYGWIILPSTTGSVYVNSSESASNHPILSVTYNHPSCAVTITRNSPPLPGEGSISENANLKVTLTGSTSTHKVKFYIKEQGSGNFRLIHLPDTQNYVNFETPGRVPIFDSQIDWIKANKDNVDYPIKYVWQVGDLVSHWDKYPENTKANSNLDEWEDARDMMYQLEEININIPYGIVCGGHDQNKDLIAEYYNQFFGVSHFYNKSYYGGHYGSNNKNHYDLFSAGNMDFVVVYLEHYLEIVNNYYNTLPPTDNEIIWANTILKKYPERRGILVSHHIICPNNEFVWPSSASHYNNDERTGERIFNGLKDCPNLFLMMSGHFYWEVDNVMEGEFRKLTTGDNGNQVYAVCADYQHRTNGGDGWLRILDFDAPHHTIHFKTYSTYLPEKADPPNENPEEDANSKFDYIYDDFLNVANIAGVSGSGGSASFIYPAFKIGKTYEWYVEVIDQNGCTTISDHWTFTYSLDGQTSTYLQCDVFLEGPYNTTNDNMNTALEDAGRLPLFQPYKVFPFNYAGNESVGSMFDGVVDWVLVELSTGTAANTKVAERVGFLKSDGRIRGISTDDKLKFYGINPGNYYIVIKHRNHLSIMSSLAVEFNNDETTTYDFRYSMTSAYGTNPMKLLETEKYGMYAGDANGDGSISSGDKNDYWRPQNGYSGYKNGDFNLNGYVSSGDKNFFWRVNNGKGTSVP